MNRLSACAQGVVYVEFLIAFMPVFTLFLGVIQLAFIAGAKLVVQHSAAMATRSAIVVLDDDPKHYAGEPRGRISTAGSGGKTDRWSSRIASRAGARSSGPPRALPARGGPRLEAIRLAAYAPLAILAPTPRTIIKSLGSTLSGPAKTDLRGAIGSAALDRALFGLRAYNRAAAAVTFPKGPRADHFHKRSVDADSVTVRVTYLYHCAIPLVSRLICDRGSDLIRKRTKRRAFWRRRGNPKSQDRVAKELEQAEARKYQRPLTITGGRFVALRAEATLPNQRARYYVRGADGS